ncbi:MAG: response regulator [Patescibacteria group bacterium]|nr:response regulator [Patescibacteria group bacterium]MDE1965962.1 response regulator [Patescibacteria group bacterium]
MQPTKLILVAEDDPVLKNLLGHTFAGTYQALYANNGAEALKLLEEYKPSLVMLDLMMPDVDGFTFLKMVRSRTDALKDVPVIVVSNLGREEDIERAKSLGANEYLVKAENSVEEIVAKIRSILEAQA